jgi:hypothetical protein
MFELIEVQVRADVAAPNLASRSRRQGMQQLLGTLRTYIR